MGRHFPAAHVAKGAGPHALPRGEPITGSGPGSVDLEAFNRQNLSTGMIVLHDGRVVYEGYWQGADAESRFTSWSIAKSITSTLIGIALGEGRIESLQDPIVRYVPELADGVYRDVTVEQALQMSSGVRWDESDLSPTSDIGRLFCFAMPPGPPGAPCPQTGAGVPSLNRFLATLDERAAAPGARFNYSSAETQVIGWVLRNAVGEPVARYLSEKLWQPLGMEDDAIWLVDPSGMEVTGLGVSARLRDFARLGLLMLNDGVHEGARILPEGWVRQATTPGAPHLQRTPASGPNFPVGYQYQWWVLPNGAFEAQGAYGQFLRVDPVHRLVVVMTSAWRSPWDIGRAIAFNDTVASIVRSQGYGEREAARP